jgi:hypothetical protein
MMSHLDVEMRDLKMKTKKRISSLEQGTDFVNPQV